MGTNANFEKIIHRKRDGRRKKKSLADHRKGKSKEYLF